jgi:hypothetical protein
MKPSSVCCIKQKIYVAPVIPVVGFVTEGESLHRDVNNQKDEEEETAKPSQQNPSKTSESEVEAIINQVASSGE